MPCSTYTSALLYLDIVEEYTYLGLLIHKSGNFKKAIKELSLKSKRAFFCLKSMLNESSVPPKSLYGIRYVRLSCRMTTATAAD